MSIESVAVVVPARDEADLIERCLISLRLAARRLLIVRPDMNVTIVVVADDCTDATADLARASLDDVGAEMGTGSAIVLTTDVGRVGAARATGVAHALAVLGGSPARTWVANTDADSKVPSNWLIAQIVAAEASPEGADVVVGTVRPDPEALTAEQNARWLETHPRGRPNGHVHGANLGVRASAYLEAGGFEALDEHEDNVLVARLRDLRVVVVASDDAEVLTSARLVGRTPGGYAGYLAATL